MTHRFRRPLLGLWGSAFGWCDRLVERGLGAVGVPLPGRVRDELLGAATPVVVDKQSFALHAVNPERSQTFCPCARDGGTALNTMKNIAQRQLFE